MARGPDPHRHWEAWGAAAPVLLDAVREASTLAMLLRTCRAAQRELCHARCRVLHWQHTGALPPEDKVCAQIVRFLERHSCRQRICLAGCLLPPCAWQRFLALPGLTDLHCLGTLLSVADVDALRGRAASLQSLTLTHCSPPVTHQTVGAVLPARVFLAFSDLAHAPLAVLTRAAEEASEAGPFLAIRLDAPEGAGDATLDDFCFAFRRGSSNLPEPCTAPHVHQPTAKEKGPVCTQRIEGAHASAMLQQMRQSRVVRNEAHARFGHEDLVLLRIQLHGSNRAWEDARPVPLPVSKRRRRA